MNLNTALIVSGLIFSIGFIGVLTRRNILIIFMSLELMLGASILALISFSYFGNNNEGSVNVLFIIIIAAAEIAIGLGLILALYKKEPTVMINEIFQP